MTKPYENMKTEKRRAKVGEWVRGTITGREATVVKVEKKSIEAYYEGEDYSGILIMPHENYEVLIESDTEALHKEIEILRTENAKLRDNIHLLQNRLDNLREDHAASEDHLCERVGRERKLAHSLMDYIRGLEVGVK